MPDSLSLAELVDRGVELDAFEAVAIARALIHATPIVVSPGITVEPPSLATVCIAADGTVTCNTCGITPSVSEVAILLQHILRSSSAKPGGGLLYSIARAMTQVDAPPFASLADFSRALERYEQGEPAHVIRELWKRANTPIAAPSQPPQWRHLDRRQPTTSVTELRRQLREADQKIYELLTAVGSIAVPQPARTFQRWVHRSMLVALLIILVTALVMHRPAVDRDPSMFSPSFASDGTAMFFHTGRSADPRSALMSVDLPNVDKPVTEDLRVLTILEDGAKNYHVHPSPDGMRIAFDSDRDGERGVYLANIDGTNVTRISGSGYAAVPTWSPRGDRLAFVRGEHDHPGVWNLWLYDLSSGATERVTNFRFGQTWGGSWFPDGERICYSHEDRLFVHDLASGRSRPHASPVRGGLVRTPAVSPDGTRVIFQVARHGAWLLDVADGSMRVVLNDPTAEEFAWSPDGRRVAFHSKRDGSWGIWFTAGS